MGSWIGYTLLSSASAPISWANSYAPEVRRWLARGEGLVRCGFASVKFRTRYPFEMKFDTLTVGMSNSPAPKPRAHGAEVWCWVPIANHMAREVLSDTDTVENSAKTAVDQLHKAYTCLSADAPFASDRLKAASHHVDWLSCHAEAPPTAGPMRDECLQVSSAEVDILLMKPSADS